MRIIDQLVYKITGDNNQFDSAINKSDAKMDGIQKRGQGLSTFMKGAFVAGFLVAGKAVIDLGLKLGNIASDAEETNNKFAVTFSGIRDEAEATAKNLSDNFGLSTLASKTLLSSTGDLLTGFGFTQEASLDLSTQVNELAVDLASFTNFSGGAEGASVALTKALLGERESVKSLGISIMEADIKQLAEDKGIVGELTRQQKAMLTLEIAVSQSKNAIGDFARSQDAYANQKRIFEGNLEDLAVKLGDRLLPMMTAVVGAGNDIVEFLVNGKNPSDELANSTDLLAGKSKALSEITATLSGDVDTLTESERLNLISKQALLRLEIVGDISEQSDNYDKLNKNIAKNTELNELDNELIKRNLSDLTKLATQEGVSVEKLVERAAAWDTFVVSAGDVNGILEANEKIETRVKDRVNESAEAIANRNLFIERTAYLVSEEILKEEAYATATQGLKDEINLAVTALDKQAGSTTKQAEATTNLTTSFLKGVIAYENWTDGITDAIYPIEVISGFVEKATKGNVSYATSFGSLVEVVPKLTKEQIDLAVSTGILKEGTLDYFKVLLESGNIYSIVGREGAVVWEGTTAAIVESKTALEEWAEANREGITETTALMNGLGGVVGKYGDLQQAQAEAEIASLDKKLMGDEAYDKAKRKILRESAEAQRKTSIFETILNTASGIAEAIPNPWLMALAGVSGALQLATINATPLPSYDVGSIRIPETTTATVHKNEMILTAPQAEQARREGITISPNGGGSQAVLMIDGVALGKVIWNHGNGGRLGVLDKKVVK